MDNQSEKTKTLADTQIVADIAEAIKDLAVIAEAIKDLKEVPSGHLYARLTNYMSLETYMVVIDILTKMDLIQVKNNLIIWVGKE